MQLLKNTINYISLFAFGTLLSCEYENIHPTGKVYMGGAYQLHCSERRDEIIIISSDVVVAGIYNKEVRKFTFPDGHHRDYPTSWLYGDTLYIVVSNKLSALNIKTFEYSKDIVEGVYIPPLTSPFHSSHFAYAKPLPATLGPLPQVYLFDIQSGQETLIGPGIPYEFSPDGKQLLYWDYQKFYRYDLETKTTTEEDFERREGHLVRWTTEGIFSFYSLGDQINKRNETTDTWLGAWNSYEGVVPGSISRTGDHIMTTLGYRGNFDLAIVNTEDNSVSRLAFGVPAECKVISLEGRTIAYENTSTQYIHYARQ